MLIRFLLVIAGLVILWLLSARHLTLLLDRFTTVRVQSLPAGPLARGHDELQIGESHLPFSVRVTPAVVHIYETPPSQVIIAVGDRTLTLGSGAGSNNGEFQPDPGDEISFGLERSLLSWPTPFEFNFMTGHAPSWKRNIYYRLIWRKRGGDRLELVWRYEQWFYGSLGGWAGHMTREGATGLIRAELRRQ